MEVKTTKDFSIFKTLKGNRVVSERNYRKLLLSIKKDALPTIITVNEHLEVIDGQHRLKAFSELNIPIDYVIRNGFGLKECHILNAISNKWDMNDFIDGYISLGYNEYKKVKDFQNFFNLKINEVLLFAGGVSGKVVEDFKVGYFEFKNIEKAYEIAEKITLLSTYFPSKDRAKGRGRKFIIAMLECFKNKDFDFNHFIDKLEKPNSYKLETQTQLSATKEMIQNIYNYNVKRKGFKKLTIK